jgi:hypothetical protein
MEVFRSDTLERVDSWTTNPFTDEWSISAASSNLQVFLYFTPGTETNKKLFI